MALTALLSVSDKAGLVPLAEGLLAHGYRILSSGGTAAALAGAGPRLRQPERLGR
jgi:phosphoribosylaminoimidazolecarboxamide formyltransferase/IMP cyclohydrolase